MSSTDVSTLDPPRPRPALRGRERTAMSALRSDPPSVTRTTGQTLASVWRAAADAPITDALAQWPADLFALASVLLAEAQAFRFALSPPRPPGAALNTRPAPLSAR